MALRRLIMRKKPVSRSARATASVLLPRRSNEVNGRATMYASTVSAPQTISDAEVFTKGRISCWILIRPTSRSSSHGRKTTLPTKVSAASRYRCRASLA